MATHTVNIDVVDKTIPIGNNRVIPVINQPNPALGYAASANEVAQLLRLANYYVYEAGTDTIINPYNYYDYFPEAGGGGGGGGGGVTPQTVQSMIDASIDSTVSDTSTKAVQNAAITNFVNSSIESSTAEFKGTYDSKVEMDAVTANQNDYAFLCVLNNDGSVNHYERYKWSDTEVSGSHWLFEYNVNNSSFTAEQWAAINSGVKDTDVSALGGHVNNTNNPHGVTKSQVGLSDVDNTSDADKPISTATQNALNTKFDTAGTGLNKNGTTVSHATPEGAATHAKAFYKFSTDALGHVNGVTEATEAEVNAIDSGITATKVGQIETNKTNILSLYKQNGKTFNFFDINRPIDVAYHAAAVVADNTITIGTVSGDWAYVGIKVLNLPADSYRISGKISNLVTGAEGTTRIAVSQYSSATQGSLTYINITQNGDFSGGFIWTGGDIYLLFYVNNSVSSSADYTYTASDLQIISTSAYNAGFTDYQPHALSNVELTQSVKPIPRLVDAGAKNFLSVSSGSATNAYVFDNLTINLPAGKYVFVADITNYGTRSELILKASDGTRVGDATFNNASSVAIQFDVTSNAATAQLYTMGGTFTNMMICTEEDYNASPKVVPHAMTNAELTAKEQQNENNILLLRAYGGLKNYATINSGTYTANSGGGTHSILIPLLSPITGDIVISIGNITSNDVDSSTCAFVFKNDITSRETVAVSRGDNINVPVSMGAFAATKVEIYPAASYQLSNGDTVSWTDLMICTKEDWDNSHDYQPHALPNTALTSGLNSYIENGVRNFAKYNHNMPSWSGVTINVSDDAISVSGTSSSAYTGFICTSSSLNLSVKEPFVIKIIGTYSGFSIITQIKDTSGTRLYWDLSLDRIIPSGYTIEGVYLQRQSATSSAVSGNFNVLITPKAIYDLGVKDYEPYAMSNVELTADVTSLAAKSQKTISSSGNTSKLRLTLNTSVMSNANRGSLLLSIPFQTSAYDNALLLIAIGNDSFLGVQRLDNSNNSMVTSWDVSANNTILDITLRAQPWSAPVAFPMAQVAPPITYSWES